MSPGCASFSTARARSSMPARSRTRWVARRCANSIAISKGSLPRPTRASCARCSRGCSSARIERFAEATRMPFTIMLYGATGYSGGIITEEAVRLGMAQGGRHDCRLILAGRDGNELEALARDANMPYRVFGLDSAGAVRDALATVDAVINAAGPFAFTAL